MQVAILGGTGDIGEGLVLRFGLDTDHRLVVGSREASRAEHAAAEYERLLRDRTDVPSIRGAENADAARIADVVVLSIPPFHIGDTVEELADELTNDQILVTPAVGMRGDDNGLHYRPPSVGSVTELVAARAPPEVPVVGAFHSLSAERLSDLDAALDIDTLVIADNDAAKETVRNLADEIDGLRSLDGGPLANAAEVESVTPLVINVARYNDDLDDVGVVFR